MAFKLSKRNRVKQTHLDRVIGCGFVWGERLFVGAGGQSRQALGRDQLQIPLGRRTPNRGPVPTLLQKEVDGYQGKSGGRKRAR